MKQAQEAFTFDDVLLKPSYSEVMPTEVETESYISRNIKVNIPIISAAMDTVTEHALAIAMAQAGGIGSIHKNLSIKEQAEEVRKVKRFESGMVINPITISPSATASEAINLMQTYHISGIPVVDSESKKLLGIITNRDVRFMTNKKELVSNLMTKEGLVTIKDSRDMAEAKRLLHQHRLEKLLVVDSKFRCIGLITVKDIEKSIQYPNATKDTDGRLRVAAAIGVGKDGIKRAEALVDAGVDLLIIDTAHGHSKAVIDMVKSLKKIKGNADVIAGNIATGEAATALIKAGVDGVKVGIGPGSICTTRIIAGVGVPQLSAVIDVSEACKQARIPLISDGGIKYSGDLAKAIAAGAHSVMIGSLFAGTEESPGDVVLYQGRSYKSYRGMGSLGAMARGSADRYFQDGVSDKMKLVPEGVEGRVPFKGKAHEVLHQLIGGLRAAMGYTGNRDIAAMRSNCKFIRITNSGLKESHAHNIIITQEAPNYMLDKI